MKHHAFVIAGERGMAVHDIERHIEKVLGTSAHPDAQWLSYDLLSVEDARTLIDRAHRSSSTDAGKVLIIQAGRLFHEAQNALLKLFEEPPPSTVIILSIPSEGILLPTLRSRLQPLPGREEGTHTSTVARAFLESSPEDRAKYAAKLVDRSKSDKESMKQEARMEAVTLLEGIMRAAHAARMESKNAAERTSLSDLLTDLTAFLPIAHDRSAPLKLMLEHLLLVIPTGLRAPRV